MSDIPEDITFDRIQACVSETLNIRMSEVEPSHCLSADLGADSLDAVELVMRIEEEFGFCIEDEDYDKFARQDPPLSEMLKFVKARTS